MDSRNTHPPRTPSDTGQPHPRLRLPPYARLPVLFLCGVVLFAIAAFFLNQHYLSRRFPAHCWGNLRSLAIAAIGYIDSHGKGRHYPGSLSEMWDAGLLRPPESYICPLDRSSRGSANGETCGYESAFDLAASRGLILPSTMDSQYMMVWEVEARHAARRVIAQFDAHTEVVSEQRFSELLQQLQEILDAMSKRQ